MKKALHIIMMVSVLLSCLAHPVSARNIGTPRWNNTTIVLVDPDYYDGTIGCFVDIVAKDGATIENVEIRLDKKIGNVYVNIASWNNLSGGDSFTFHEIVSDVDLGYTYRLSVTANVTLNGVVDAINNYAEEYYA